MAITCAGAGSGVNLCATLTAQRAGRRYELPDKPVTFSIDGRALGASTTDAHGRACLLTRAPGQASTYPVHAVFAGDRPAAQKAVGEVAKALEISEHTFSR